MDADWAMQLDRRSEHLLYRQLDISIRFDVNDIHVPTIEIAINIYSCGHPAVFTRYCQVCFTFTRMYVLLPSAFGILTNVRFTNEAQEAHQLRHWSPL